MSGRCDVIGAPKRTSNENNTNVPAVAAQNTLTNNGVKEELMLGAWVFFFVFLIEVNCEVMR